MFRPARFSALPRCRAGRRIASIFAARIGEHARLDHAVVRERLQRGQHDSLAIHFEKCLFKQQVTLLNPEPLGLRINVFIQVSLEKQMEDALQRFEQAISERPEVMECYLMTGDADYLLRVVMPDMQALERFIVDHLTKIPGISNIRSSFALKQVRYKTALPLPSSELTLADPDDVATDWR
ncbi:hypothetical protein LMG28614_02064 [Paraburkholderia ultramafica]|uniref:Transcription regulator AsnC/Lrp ligand binding domain-containing protein n=1 Tax=Paraburkholderia ultramafica TaxID=1544867 RepID=A0A6S7BB57_9BURK|nr:Lrp/AsnC family transcriptional regulator [Paraburkholderia ultramafica]CAB3785160.1 hypothetical protein LMG28614_02064 [Paraburkholderia ultramafica]